jgi:hypothetical protein
MTDEDAFWAARQVAAFTDDEIRAIVATGEYSDARASEWVTRCLIERRNKIAAAFLSRVVAADRFRVDGGELRFDRLAAAQRLQVQWFTFDNSTGRRAVIVGAAGWKVPSVPAEYLAAEITSERGDSTTVYIRNGRTIVGREFGRPNVETATVRLVMDGM